MKLYKIRDWGALFENNRSRTVIDLSWVPIPNRHDGENFSMIMAHENGAEIFAAWVLILQVASRCQPRGTLLRDNKKPHNSASLAIKTRAPENWFKIALDFLENQTDWLEIEGNCQYADTTLAPSCQAGDEERKKEGNGKKERIYSPESRVALHWLNEKSGRHYRESESSLSVIQARLNENGVDIDGVKKMIERQCKRWLGTSQEEYLRPETLFGKTKFDSYYAAKELPIQNENNSRNNQQHPDRSIGTANEGTASQYKGLGRVAKIQPA